MRVTTSTDRLVAGVLCDMLRGGPTARALQETCACGTPRDGSIAGVLCGIVRDGSTARLLCVAWNEHSGMFSEAISED